MTNDDFRNPDAETLSRQLYEAKKRITELEDEVTGSDDLIDQSDLYVAMAECRNRGDAREVISAYCEVNDLDPAKFALPVGVLNMLENLH